MNRPPGASSSKAARPSRFWHTATSVCPRVLVGHFDFYRPIGTPAKCEQPQQIDRFRDKLRAWPSE